jgi:hypothetical protein
MSKQVINQSVSLPESVDRTPGTKNGEPGGLATIIGYARNKNFTDDCERIKLIMVVPKTKMQTLKENVIIIVK